ncbi:glutathione peroxidase [Anianabacter salinae]|uniref:glutathione peroxidase n=1 Tax=Anianabacter salinae TaxID=2851023 RepID=UPI00225DE7FC|nr:glutathione peroxidase [Anianabacter salinae]MBV0912667.1 glutathione peroxidase [Anianabacter salinae]
MLRAVIVILSLALAAPAYAIESIGGFSFRSIDGGTIDSADWQGSPVLVANTASLCAYTPQYDGLQALYDTYRARGLLVLAVPSDDFAQELGDEAAVKEFCAVNFDLDLPMTEITPVRGREAHPFYAWLRETEGFVPNWNFNKVLIGPDGTVIDTYGSGVDPMSPRIRTRIEALLSQ